MTSRGSFMFSPKYRAVWIKTRLSRDEREVMPRFSWKRIGANFSRVTPISWLILFFLTPPPKKKRYINRSFLPSGLWIYHRFTEKLTPHRYHHCYFTHQTNVKNKISRANKGPLISDYELLFHLVFCLLLFMQLLKLFLFLSHLYWYSSHSII